MEFGLGLEVSVEMNCNRSLVIAVTNASWPLRELAPVVYILITGCGLPLIIGPLLLDK